MRSKFDEQLALLNSQLTEMGALCENVIALAAKALQNREKKYIDKVIELDTEIDQSERDIETLCLKLLLQQQPVARDLRQISSALKMITDMERIGDQAADIAEIVSFADVSDSIDTVHIGKMAEATIKMVNESIEAFVTKDIKAAESVIKYDDVVDNLFDEVKTQLVAVFAKPDKNVELAIDLLMIAKYFERIGDHAVNIAEWVIFSISGIHESNE
ncbi:MAG: phosphate signaling complex protein PhoU [Firmicutes bacterium]|nr:phosphate signaling complex protein PhoU [Bacillota bacterium]